jgi:hypothetical protein
VDSVEPPINRLNPDFQPEFFLRTFGCSAASVFIRVPPEVTQKLEVSVAAPLAGIELPYEKSFSFSLSSFGRNEIKIEEEVPARL